MACHTLCPPPPTDAQPLAEPDGGFSSRAFSQTKSRDSASRTSTFSVSPYSAWGFSGTWKKKKNSVWSAEPQPPSQGTPQKRLPAIPEAAPPSSARPPSLRGQKLPATQPAGKTWPGTGKRTDRGRNHGGGQAVPHGTGSQDARAQPRGRGRSEGMTSHYTLQHHPATASSGHAPRPGLGKPPLRCFAANLSGRDPAARAAAPTSPQQPAPRMRRALRRRKLFRRKRHGAALPSLVPTAPARWREGVATQTSAAPAQSWTRPLGGSRGPGPPRGGGAAGAARAPGEPQQGPSAVLPRGASGLISAIDVAPRPHLAGIALAGLSRVGNSALRGRC